MSRSIFQEILFKPSVRRNMEAGTTKVSNITLGGAASEEDSADPNPTGSFRYDPPGAPLKSTQQLSVDFSKFENHTFFNSAEMKVQVAYDKIINGFPFDGTRAEYQQFIDSMTGFEKYVLDKFPKNKGYLNFKREDDLGNPINNYLAVPGLKGTSVLSADLAGSGQYVADLNKTPFTIGLQLAVPVGSNDNNVIVQKVGSVSGGEARKGLTLALTASASPNYGRVLALLSSGSTFISASVRIEKGAFQNITTVYDASTTGRLFMYVGGELITSSTVGTFGSFGIEGNLLRIASGSKHAHGGLYDFTPNTQLSGAIDELRIFEAARSQKQIQTYVNKSLFAPKDGSLKLYYKFNEPSGSFGSTINEDLVLDYSGYGMHGHVRMGSGGTFDMSLRSTASLAPPLLAENLQHQPVLFPSFHSVVTLNSDLLVSASRYDYNNPNQITKLIPKHYLSDEGLQNENGDLSLNYGFFTDVPGGGRMQSAQIIASLLYLWAGSLDEVKMFVDAFGKLLSVDYRSERTISDQLLPFLAKYYGFNLPNTFANSNMLQYFEGENITLDPISPRDSLQKIQNTMWRNVLTDLPEILSARGTRNSIESMLRNMGIKPDGSFRIKEYGGSMTRKISDVYVKRSQIAAMLDFSGSSNVAGVIGGSGKDSNRPLIQSGYLSGSRVEPGVPYIAGTFVNGVSNDPNDGLFTSGSWNVEGLFRLDKTLAHPLTQSLIRLQTTGSRSDGTANNWLVFNVVAFGATNPAHTGSVALYGRPMSGSSAPTLKLLLSGTDVFNGRQWHVSFGRCRNDLTGSYLSSSYYLRAGQMGDTKITEYAESTSYFGDSGDSVLNQISGSTNAFGPFVTVGSQSMMYDSSLADGGFLNTVTDTAAKNLMFTGRASSIRFFSKNMVKKETLQHIRSFESLGVKNPNINFNFNTVSSGSFERLRLNLSCDQPVTKSNSDGNLHIFDFSQNSLHASGSGFGTEKEVIKPERFDYMILSPNFADGSDPNKVRIRSFQRAENVKAAPAGVSYAPLHEIPDYDRPKDDRRFAVEISSVQALNEDIIKIFATLDYLDSAIGDPELIFSQEYRDLRHLRQIYFNRLTEKVSLAKFFEFFKWFDQTVGGLIEELIPSTTRYLGTNFVVESHMLERPKFTYKYSDMYVGIVDRRESSVIFLRQYVGSLRKF